MLSERSTNFKIGGKISEYERSRLDKIRRNKALLDSLFPDLKESKEKIRSSLSMKRKQRRRSDSAPYTVPNRVSGPVVVRRNPGRKARNSLTPSHCPPGATVCQKTESCSLDDDYYKYESKIRVYRNYTSDPVEIDLDSDEETEEEREERIKLMQKPAHHVMEKKYDRTHGTTCHQCRQKTLDGKTRCNNKNCVGVRGQFCGVCLLNRYGEDAETAIADKTWVCPPCKGYCNCSVCLSKKGKAPTGVLHPFARERGFNSVKDYLASFKKEEKSEEEPNIDLITTETLPSTGESRDPPPSDPPSEMDYDDENKENIDPELRHEKENLPVKMRNREIIPLSARIVLHDARASYRDDHANDASYRDDHANDTDGDVDKIRRSTERMNISNPEDEKMESPVTSPSTRPKRPSRIISRCLITWQTSKYAGGHQWVDPERIPKLERDKAPPLRETVQVRWGKNKINKLYPAILNKVEYSLRRRKSCKF
ncbi:uncharacterized protein LOC134819537 [Bolinopsis microptera]|uniref:uncharacterized protein LOC134819537 n=1 Tax=Bolinopsis microptera TaxID=2820187 RepID=UPI00307A417D